jgi:HK97 family phage major capsid protein
MYTARELRQMAGEKLDAAKQLVDGAESENRDLTQDETQNYDELVAQAETYQERAARMESIEEKRTGLTQIIENRSMPPVNNGPLGDNETRAMAAFFRNGDIGGVKHLATRDKDGMGLNLRIPMAHEIRAVVDSTMNITTAADGANLVPTGFVQDVAMRKAEKMLATVLGCRRIPGKGTTVNYPVENADPEVFAATSEQSDAHDQNYERDAGNTALKAFTLAKKTRKIELTEEILEDEDVGLMDYIAGRIVKQVAGTHNALLVAEAGSNGTAFKTYASASAIAAGEPEDIVFNDTLGYYLEDEGAGAWIGRPSTFGNIASLTGNARLYAETPGGSFAREILGYPYFYSNKVTATAASAKDLYFGDWDYMGYREAPSMRFIYDPYSVDGLVVLKYSFRVVYGVLQAGAIGYGVHPSA